MNEEEAIKVLKNMDIEIEGQATCRKCVFKDDTHCTNSNRRRLSNDSYKNNIRPIQ